MECEQGVHGAGRAQGSPVGCGRGCDFWMVVATVVGRDAAGCGGLRLLWRVRGLTRGLLDVVCVRGGRRHGCTQGNPVEGCHYREWGKLGGQYARVFPLLASRPDVAPVEGRDAKA